ncbi:MAG: hypothetical protein A3H98_06135 [Bacteroidetes bacterium RIFCSPLOWO2_02_FULL_36_8]|nr:MAG: hypothetical protein A3H98_06135 [Bacteroidetes bacterium RIFCSPLOWO2_02_FULL_36_8]OFY72081.1 MAG: hypothetical protein A3G23_06870 [Bacteroidetes bacterium RIFCSPLOWO2_12_FULL_37_12]
MKPVIPVKIISLNNTTSEVNAVFDTGSYYTIIRTDKLPPDTQIIKNHKTFRTANKQGGLTIFGETILIIQIGKKRVDDKVLVSAELGSEMLIGAKTMQSWDISIINTNGKTKINVAHDMRDPEITEVD